jgi:hypothetical protein
MKTDLAGGILPSALFGANAAWWSIMLIALNLNVTMKRQVLGTGWAERRMKAVRYHLIGVAGRLVRHGRGLVLRLERADCRLLDGWRERIQALAVESAG